MVTIKKIITLLSILAITLSSFDQLNAQIPFFNKKNEKSVDKTKQTQLKGKEEKQTKSSKNVDKTTKEENDVVSSYIADEISFELKKLKHMHLEFEKEHQ